MADQVPQEIRTALGRNLTHGMLDMLGRAIVTGAYDGKRFPTEAELTDQHGVSRSVTREAVKMLTAKGLLSARPRQGTVIQPSQTWNLFDSDVLGWLLDRKFSLDLLRQFNELRIGIEPQAARLAAMRAHAPKIAMIRQGYDRMVAAEVNEDDPLEADINFHVAVLRATGNPFYMQFEELVSTALRSSIRFTNRFKGRNADLGAHEAVLLAIEARDEAAAEQRMQAIIVDVLDLIATRSDGAPGGPSAL
jgi:DNA-binding FadR family transcriptional regulator